MEMKQGKFFATLLLTSVAVQTAYADDDKAKICNGYAPPIMTTADFNGDGIVNEDDVVLISKARKKEIYYPFYDLNADGKINRLDIRMTRDQIGQTSSNSERLIAKIFHGTKQYQTVESPQELVAMDYLKLAESLAGHGEHWFDIAQGGENPFYRPGLNFSHDRNQVMGMYWAIDAIPVFENGATDYPAPGGDWEDSRVIAFAGTPPKYTDRPDEKWHTHAGLCITMEMGNSGPQMVLNQHTTYAQCQQRPSLIKPDGVHNMWSNLWMLHAWMFDLNPNGLFANTHPCADPDAPLEETINGDREVPPFFKHHGA